ncbi:uncharacterized protein LOC131881992 isoform X3 [Tigriopus californicus]|uniref:uncharacterized protein LOC131881992 isoform X3 n=1 Tax=Tigriopus californicus TaxID=6832 RepID=UPI0027DAB0B4|nr:uncharacterized protein LOC131881992 isoform X3 [Tigriopus californicus]|eukprot:TCALIF_03249-PA protein Name:"Protein of unknown function" AED:0.04 eAED:0.03 QI:190/0.9/0.63/1/0.7/0.72/11/57/560
MKLHTITQWSATAGFAIILIWLTTATTAQTELKEALEDIANVRVSRSEIKKEIKSKLEQKKVRKRQPELIEDLEASGSDFQPASGYEVPPVITNNVGHSSSHGGLKTGYFPPTQRVMPRVNQMEAECSDDVMKLRVKFNATFDGLIYSAGYAYDNDCIYINGTGADEYEFYIQLNRCGTLGGSDHNKKREVGFKNTEPTKNFMWNTVTIQYNPLIEEEWDEHFKVTCEYGYDFWKTVTFPFLDVEVNTADPVHFTLIPPECHMEIRAGYGAQGPRVTGPVHVGDPLTLLINMRSQFDGFDIVVNDCYAHNGANKKIQLIDHHGCPVDEKLISKFQGSWGMDGAMYQTVIYAHMKTFRFTGTPALYIECDIRMCHGRCPTQSCNWRNVRRRKRSTGEIDREPRGLEAVVDNDDQYFDLEEVGDSSVALDGQVGATAPAPSTNQSQPLSENLRIFQAIHVLQGRDEEEGGGSSPTTSSAVLLEDVEDNICLRSMVFASIFGILSLFTLTSSVALSLLCMRVRRMKKSDPSYEYRTTTSTHGQLRAARSAKSDYVHSIHQRIP